MHNQGIPTHHTSTEPKWQTERTGTPKKYTMTHHRNEIEIYPTLIWTREEYPRTEKDSEEPKLNDTEKHDPLLGVIGILPRTIQRDLVAMGHNQTHINTENMVEIRRIIQEASIKAYSIYKKWETSAKIENKIEQKHKLTQTTLT